jgi:HSP20 family protein
MGFGMITGLSNHLDALLSLQRALEERSTSEWDHGATTSRGPFPPVNVFQKGEDLIAIIELPGIERSNLAIEARENTVRISGKKVATYDDAASVHRRERSAGEFDRTLSVPVPVDPAGISAEYQNGVLSLYLPKAQSAKPRTIKIK